MSIKDGKSKNWGSRSGKTNKKASSLTAIEKLLCSLPSDILETIKDDPSSLSKEIEKILSLRDSIPLNPSEPKLKMKTSLGKLYQGDCLSLLEKLPDDHIDCIFADPPFNLRKQYDDSSSDDLPEEVYIEWTKTWLEACVQKLKVGGSFFVYNIPKWNVHIANFLNQKLTFKDWIAVDLTMSMPIQGRLYPSHYSLLYFVKGAKPNTFTPPRLPIKTCIKCGHEQNDYGGYKNKMNPSGVNLRDVWTDIPPVRHSKYKNRDANELSIKLLDRVLDISTKEGDIVFDPFGGSGTTYVAAELKNRKWIGVELGDCAPIVKRLSDLQNERELLAKYRKNINTLFTDKAIQLRYENGLPLNNYRIEKEQIERALKNKNLRLPDFEA